MEGGGGHERDALARWALHQKLKGLAADDGGPCELVPRPSVNLPVPACGFFGHDCFEKDGDIRALDFAFSRITLHSLQLFKVVAVSLRAPPSDKRAQKHS
jgi:hypothetical protein